MTKNAREIIEAVGAGNICERLGVSHHSVRAAKTAGTFPASWFMWMRSLCDEHHVECPMEAFNWRSPEQRSAGSADGDTPSQVQGGLSE